MKLPYHVIRVNNPFKIRWDLLIMLLSVWNCFSLPVDIAFSPPIFQTLGNIFINHITDALFIADLLLSFRTTVIDEVTGQEIIDPR